MTDAVRLALLWRRHCTDYADADPRVWQRCEDVARMLPPDVWIAACVHSFVLVQEGESAPRAQG